MRYIMLVYQNEGWDTLSKDEKNRVHAACTAWHEALVQSGHSVGAAGLQPAASATTLRTKHGKVVFTDGPFAETKEVLGGFEIFECKTRDEMLAIAQTFPSLGVGFAVEVRPLVGAEGCWET